MSNVTTQRKRVGFFMPVECMWCHKVIGYKPTAPSQHGQTSHGACRACTTEKAPYLEHTEEMIREWDALEASLKEHPNGI